jgi:hypothetical protein
VRRTIEQGRGQGVSGGGPENKGARKSGVLSQGKENENK